MLVEILKNPVIFGLLAGAIVYNYMAWVRKKEIEKRLKKGKKIKSSLNNNDIIIPSIVAIIVWFIAFAYFNHKDTMHIEATNKINNPIQLATLQNLQNSPSDLFNKPFDKPFTLISRSTGGMSLPPDVIV